MGPNLNTNADALSPSLMSQLSGERRLKRYLRLISFPLPIQYSMRSKADEQLEGLGYP